MNLSPRGQRLAVSGFCALVLIVGARNTRAQAADTPTPGGVTLQMHVNVAIVPVVVRDAQGHAIGGLKQSDFKLYDQGKQRPISGFSVEEAGGTGVGQPAAPEAAGAATPASATASSPRGVVIFLFDDRHLGAGDLEQVKSAATHMLGEPLPDGMSAVVLSFLGVNSGMTHDHVPLQAAIAKLKTQQIARHDASQCPDIDYYTADQIVNRHSDSEYQIAFEQAANCSHMGSKTNPGYVEQLVRTAANQSLLTGDSDVRQTLGFLRNVVQSMARLPGQRTLVLVSPGFLTASDEGLALQSQVMDMAAASQVVISTLDAEGLSPGSMSASRDTSGSVFSNITGQPLQNHHDTGKEGKMVMSELADGTGGRFFRNNNDMAGGLRAIAAGPEHLYLLEFSLQNVKQNGQYHPLKVEVDQAGMKVQARRGYFAPVAAKNK